MTEVITTETPEENNITHEGMLYAVSGTKLIIMSIFTLSLYNFYWFYKNFELSRIRYNDETIPLARALFSPIFAFALFTTINSELENLESSKKLHVGILAGAYFILNLSGQLLPPQYWLISFLVVVPLLSANQRIIDLNNVENPSYQPHSKFTLLNWLFLFPLGAVTVLAILGTFLEAP